MKTTPCLLTLILLSQLTTLSAGAHPGDDTRVVAEEMADRIGIIHNGKLIALGTREELRDQSGSAPRGTIDVRSEGFGVGDPPALPTQHGAGALSGGTLPAIAYTSQSKQWGPVPPAPVRT